jgi:hypothetical protein
MDSSSGLIIAGVVLLLAGFAFVVLREIVLWYFRVGEIVNLLKRQVELLEIITAERTASETKDSPEPLPPTPRPNPLTRK